MKLAIEDLIANKALDELTEAERAWVLTQMTAEEYQLQHSIIAQSQALWAEEEQALTPVPASAAIHTALQQKQKTRPQGLLVAVFSHRVRTWQAVAASLLFFLLWQIGGGASASEESGIVAQEQAVDTVYRYLTQVKEVLQPADTIIKIVYKEVVRPATEAAPKPALMADASDSLDLEAVAAAQASPYDDILRYRSVPSGQPASRDTFFQLLGGDLQL